MNPVEQITQIYNHLPAVAQQEVLDFMLFVQQRHSDTGIPQEKKSNNTTIRDNPAFGMWSDLQGDSREQLKHIRQTQWTRP